MAFAAPSTLRNPSGNPSSYSRRRLPYAGQRPLPRYTIVKCQQLPFQNPKPKENDKFSLKSIVKPLAIASISAATASLRLLPFTLIPNLISGGGSNFGGNGGGGGGGSGGGNGDANFWEQFLSPATAIADEDNQAKEWDSHGLPANIAVQLNKLSGFKKYKVSEIIFFDKNKRTTFGTDDSFFEMVSVRPGGIYTKTQLLKELETLATCGMFEKVDMEGKTKPDGTIGLTISFTESIWEIANSFRCINVGLMPQSKPIEMDSDMTEKEKYEYYLSQEKDYKKRIQRAKPCLLPTPVREEVLTMLKDKQHVTARLLQRIRDRVQKWYHDEGYACAQVVNFGNLNTSEVVCEVVEGDITQVVIQFLG